MARLATPIPITGASPDPQTLQTLEEQRRQIATLQQQINQLRTSGQNTSTSSSEDLRQTVAQLNQKNEALIKENRSLKAQATSTMTVPTVRTGDTSAVTINSLKSEIDRLKVANTNLKSQLSSNITPFSQTTQAQKNTQTDLQSQLADSKRKLERLTYEKQQLQVQLNLTKPSGSPSLDDMKRTLVTLNQRYDQLQQENRSLKSQLAATGQNQSKPTAAPDTALAAKQAEISQLKNDVQLLRKQLQQAQSTQSDNPSVEEMQHTLVTINQRYNQLIAENKRLKDENANIQVQPRTSTVSDTTLQNLRQQLTQAQQSLNNSIGTINEQNKEIAYLRNQVTDVKAGMDASSRTQLSQLRAERDEKAARVRELEQQLAAKAGTPQTTGSQATTATLKRQLEQVTLQYQTTVDDLTRQLSSKAQQVQEREQQLTEARSVSQQRVAQLQAQVSSLQTQLNETEQKAIQTQNTAGQANQISSTELQKRNAQISALQTELAQLKTQQSNAAALKTELDALKRTSSSTGQATTALKTEISKLAQENQGLKTKLTELQKSTSSDSQINASLKTELAQLSQENQSLKAQLAAQPKQIATDTTVLRDEIARLTEENQSLKAQKSAATPADLQLKTQVAGLQSQVNTIKLQYEKALNDAKQARTELASQKKVMMATKPAAGNGSAVLQKQVTDLNHQLASLRAENTTLREKASASASNQPASTNPEAEKNYQEAKAALEAGTLESALEKYQAAQLLEPDNARYTVDYSIALAQDHEYAEASDLLRRYLQRNPADREAYGQLGKIYLLNDQTEMATQALSRAIPIGTLNNYATALKKAGKNDDAESIFKMALKLNPNDSEVLFNLGNLYNATERLELARNSYLQAIQVKPDFAEAHYNLGLIYSKLGDRVKAVTYLEKFLQLSPNARNADTIRAYVEKLKV